MSENKPETPSVPDIVNCSSILSTLYALLLCAAFTALTSARIVNFPAKHHQLQISNFLVFLLSISIIFLLYIFLYLTRPKSPDSSTARILPNDKSHGSFFLRQGAVVFGLGTLVYALLEFTSTFQVFHNSDCNDILHSMHSLVFFLFALFVFLQSLAIVMYPRLNICKFPVVAKFGMIHLVTTNVIIWIQFIVKESIHELVEAEEAELKRHGHDHENHSCMEDYLSKLVHEHHGHCKHEENFNNFLGDTLISASPYLFAFIIEFSLIGATVFYATWCNVGKPPSPSSQTTKKIIVNPHPKVFVSNIDWSHSLCGLLLGSFVALLNLINLLTFFVTVSQEDEDGKVLDGDEFMEDMTNTLLNFFGIVACIAGLAKTQQLDRKQEEQEESSLDLNILYISGFFMYFYSCLTTIVGFNTTAIERGNNVLMIINGLVEMLYVTLQIIFLTILLQKKNTGKTNCTDSCQALHDGCKPGRQAVTFLILLNSSQWSIATFELQKSLASPWERSFYGFAPWVILQRISLPLCIFFRFHSAVIAVDCWKNVYKTDNTNNNNNDK